MLSAWLQRQDNVTSKGIPSWSVLRAALERMGENEIANRDQHLMVSCEYSIIVSVSVSLSYTAGTQYYCSVLHLSSSSNTAIPNSLVHQFTTINFMFRHSMLLYFNFCQIFCSIKIESQYRNTATL